MINKSLTLVEVLIAIAIIAIAIAALATMYPGIFGGVNLDLQSLRAWEIAKQEMETLKSYTAPDNFAAFLYNVSYDPAPGANATPVANVFSTGLANTSGVYYVEWMRDINGARLTDLVKAEVVVCYRTGNRIVGEDRNFNATLDAGEDTNNDRKISSPVSLSTLIMQQQ